MTIINYLTENWKSIAAAGAMTLSAAVHGYQIIVQAGGYRNIWRKFRDGDTPRAA